MLALTAEAVKATLGVDNLMDAYQIYQSAGHHGRSFEQASRLTRTALNQASDHHFEAQHLSKSQHSIQMARDKAAARREHMRDKWTVKSAQANTLMVMNVLMFGCSFGIVVEGKPPVSADAWKQTLFSLTLALSLSGNFLSIIFVGIFQRRLGKFPFFMKWGKFRSGYFRCSTMLATYTTFSQYYGSECAWIQKIARVLFWCSSVMLMSTAMLFLDMRFRREFENVAAAWMFVIPILITLFLAILILYAVPHETRLNKPDYLNGEVYDWHIAEPPVEIINTDTQQSPTHSSISGVEERKAEWEGREDSEEETDDSER